MAAVGGLTLLLAFSIAASLTPLIRDLARRNGLMDFARTSRKVHGRPIPRLGGVAIVVAFYAAVSAATLWPTLDGVLLQDPESAVRTGTFLAGGIAIFLLGIYDDLKGAGAKQKFTVQFAVAGLLYAAGLRIDVVANPFGESVALGWLSLPVTLLWVAGVMNAMNLIDGLDGVAAGLAFAAAAMAFVVGADAGQLLAVVSAAALAGAVAGFLVYNFSPASIFMGDTGSMFLGYVLAASALLPRRENGEVALVAFVVALGLPILDTLAAIARRASRGVPVFVADREHLHHRLLDLGLSQRQVSLTLWSVGALLAGTGATLAGSGPATMLVAIAVAGALAWVSLGRWGFESTSALRARRRRNVERRRAIRVAGERLRRAKGLADLAETLQAVGVALGARSIRLHFDASEGSTERVPVRFGPAEDPVAAFRTTHGIFGERSGSGSIEVVWREGCTSLDRDSEIAIELLCDHLAAALRHLDRAAPRGAEWLRELRVTPVPHGAPRRTVREHVDRASPG